MILIELRCTHYSPKDLAEAIKEFLIADSIEQALPYIDRVHLFGNLADMEADGETTTVYPNDEFFEKRPDAREEAKTLGLEVNEHEVEGPAHLITKWWRGTTWKDVEDAYYGVTHYEWGKHQEITAEQASVLTALGVAKDIRHWEPQ